jgi:hypothetical protein
MKIKKALGDRQLIVGILAAAALASAQRYPAIAKPKKDLYCGIDHKVCYKGCGVIGSQSDLGEKCRRSCDFDLWKCHDKEAKGGKDNRPQGDSGPEGGPVAKDPSLPTKSGPSSGLPKTGTWHGPASPSKSGPIWNGLTLPPKRPPQPVGNQWHSPTSAPKSTGGTIHKSGSSNR